MKRVFLCVLMLFHAKCNGVKFVMKPENGTFVFGVPFSLKCGVDSSSPAGIEWQYIPISDSWSKIRIGEWIGNSIYKTPPSGYQVDRPDNFTSYLTVMNPSMSAVGNYCCQYNNAQGETACAFMTTDNLPKNVVVMTGTDKVLDCAQGGPFRWYRYLPSDPSDDKVLFMGSNMADNIDERFRVLREPQSYPFQRLDLLINDIQANHSGTYKCKLPQIALCAELIVLASEPNCRIHMSKNTTANEMVELKCSVNVTENGKPEMLCVHQTQDTLTATSCSARHNGMVTCMTRVPAAMQAGYKCSIRIKHKPLRTYKTCNHATNEPDYQYTWQSSSGISDYVDFMAASAVSDRFTMMELCLSIVSCASVALNVILFVLCIKKQLKGHTSGKDSATSSVETLSSECDSLTSEKQEDMKAGVNCNVYSSSGCIPLKIDVEKQV